MTPHRIMIADDNVTFAETMLHLCDGMGVALDCAGNGARAVEMAAEAVYALIFMDLHMPAMGGIEAAKLIRTLPPPHNSPRILALTGYPSENVSAECLAAGIDEILVKPYEMTLIERKILSAISFQETLK